MSDKPKGRVQEFDPDHVRDISEAVYRDRLGEDDTRRMIDKAKGDESVIRRHAGGYDSLTRSYLRALKGGGHD